MKKLLIVALLLSILTACESLNPDTCSTGFELVGNECVKIEDNTDQCPINQELVDGTCQDIVCDEDYVLEDGECTKVVTFNDAYDLLNDYVDYILTITPMMGMEEGEFHSPNILFLSEELEDGVYTKEDFETFEPAPSPYNFNWSLGEIGYIIVELYNILETNLEDCKDIVEGETCRFTQTQEYNEDVVDDINLSFEINDTALTLYRYTAFTSESYFGTIHAVSLDAIELKFAGELLEFGYLRHYLNQCGDDLYENMYYDVFVEDSYVMNLSIRNNNELYYYKYTSDDNVVLFNYGGEGTFIRFTNEEQSVRYAASYNEAREMDHLTLDFLDENGKTELGYQMWSSVGQLSWNMLFVDGWNSADCNDPQNPIIYNGDALSLPGFTGSCEFNNYRANLFITNQNININDVTDTDIALTNYGLSYNEVSAEELTSEYNYVKNSQAELFEEAGFSLDYATNEAYIDSFFNMEADTDFMTTTLLDLITASQE